MREIVLDTETTGLDPGAGHRIVEVACVELQNHLATGRSDHLGGDLSSADFNDRRNATHNDILWSPNKTPEVELARVTMFRNGDETVILENQAPTEFLKKFL